jgi:acyl-CoA synthetase (AMP-forming)/AMP-acid ligase II
VANSQLSTHDGPFWHPQGGTNTTINPLYTVEELSAQLNDAGASYLLTVPPFLDKAIEAAGRSGVREVFVLGQAQGATPFAALLRGGRQPPEVRIDPHADLAVLPYSNGTTGLPKGVMLSHTTWSPTSASVSPCWTCARTRSASPCCRSSISTGWSC